MAETSTIPVIRYSYMDGSTERGYSAEIEAWLPSQPQGTRVMYLKHMIWDGMESMVQRLVEDPDCDIAVVAYIFWACQPGFTVAHEKTGEFKGPRSFAKMGCLTRMDRFSKELRRTSTGASIAAASSRSTGSTCSTARSACRR